MEIHLFFLFFFSSLVAIRTVFFLLLLSCRDTLHLKKGRCGRSTFRVAQMIDTKQLCSKLDGVLHRFTTHGKGEDLANCEDMLSDIKIVTSAVEGAAANQSSDSPLPVKVLEELRLLGSACWNVTMRCTDHSREHERRLKVALREFATRSFLLGNFVYSEESVRHSYFTHHPREAEQCILMCLKTSRDLSLNHMPEGSKALLAAVETIVPHIPPGVVQRLPHLKHRNLSWEFEYTKMEVMWNLGHLFESSQSCERLAQMLLRDNTLHRTLLETFFHFVFTVGSAEVEPPNECFIRDMLMSSINVQNYLKENGGSDAPCRLPMLRGATLEQMALSWLREGNASEAVRWAVEADSALQSNTSALLRLKATAAAGMEKEASVQLREYVQRLDVTVDDAVAVCFDFQKLFTTMESGSVESMQLLQNRTKGTSAAEGVTFRLVQLLLHSKDTESCRSALQIMRNECLDFEDPKYRRYCFKWLWELSDNAEFSHGEAVESLEAAIRLADCASDSEINALQLHLCTKYVESVEQGQQVNMLAKPKDILLRYTERKPRCVFAHALLFKIFVMEGSETCMKEEIHQLVACEPSELVTPALCTAINCCLKRNCLNVASLAALQALLSPVPFADVRTELEVLRVYVTTAINRSCAHSDDDLYKLTQRIQNILSEGSATLKLTHDEVMWWTQAFLLLGSEFTLEASATSIALFRTAACIAEQDPSPREAGTQSPLLAAILCMLEDEFRLFSTGNPLIDLADLEKHLNACRDLISTTYTAECRVTFLLSKSEWHLRGPSIETPQEMDEIVRELSTIPVPYNVYEALAEAATFEASRVPTECSYLREFAMGLFAKASLDLMERVAASTEVRAGEEEAVAETLTKNLSCLYKAFTLGSDRKEQMCILQHLMSFLSLPVMGITVGTFLGRYGAVGERGVTANNSSAFALLILEYFTVEAWNNSVFYLHINNTEKQGEWVRAAWALVDILPPTHRVVSALHALRGITGC
ncbi:hypothetical protein, conserved [Trypanosoma brucei gambiense DAL972]|uniref:Uncharacterized protein n=1 Tax=Trypanosoma brucei gambiense (strain MHOM/CI/86/DAL972) TaxID=679716 RepID=D0A008_TRYB9|nr:hypothetical protein, conserved [Trypanosoma brucei gambiense DAL972]CBH16566.1 hypothetical protein, conserved [Trypanosoma brucei gambiense DAL972]|eukprot:XP_011778830.1 hypothetical protein, conserved [Trypanosoma brucei gambiense DAL972]